MTESIDPDSPRWVQRLASDPEAFIPLEPADAHTWSDTDLGDREPPKSGILNIDKPDGQTSHDVVNAVRRAAGLQRVGHAGTLDPMATGVLLVCIGSATRVIEELQHGRKSYRATVRLGATTTTYDAEGEVVDTKDSSHLNRADIESGLVPFRGAIRQVPPMYAAIRHDGRRLYELARAGIEVERQARPVHVDDLRLVAWDPPELQLEMSVSRGFYVRSLAHDLGQALGVGAHLTALQRTAVGDFEIEGSERLSRVVEAFVDGWWPQILHPLDTALQHIPALVVDDAREAALRFGQQIDGPAPRSVDAVLARAYSTEGWFIGLVRFDDVTERWQPERVFPAVT